MRDKTPVEWRTTLDEHPLLVKSVAGKIIQAKKKVVDEIRHAQSWEDFIRRCGVLLGLEEALKLCEEAEKEMMQ